MSSFWFGSSKNTLSNRDEVILRKLNDHRLEFIANDNGTLSIDLNNIKAAKRLAEKIRQLKNFDEVVESK